MGQAVQALPLPTGDECGAERQSAAGKVFPVVHYRSFRNDDPPGLAEIWNAAFTGRGAVQLRHSSPLERFAFCKPYFDPEGITVALEDDKRVGFAHAGFGANHTQTGLSFSAGVTCVIGVRPAFQRRGIGTELLKRSEAYLKNRGAETVLAGPMRPLNPFYFGLYGGSDLPGFLVSDAAAGPFLERRGYQVQDTCVVFQRQLDRQVNVQDARFPDLRRRYEVQVTPRSAGDTWWHVCTLGPLELLEFRVVATLSGHVVAVAQAWEMEGFSWRWGMPAVGILDLEVRQDLRRQGLAKFLMASILRYLQEQYFGLVEIQALEQNLPALTLLRTLEFEQVDVGHSYRRGQG
jgi:ribosomal protein S18 acetylase RimI-like enzyme